MAIRLILSDEDKNILNEALRQYALPTMNKKKQTLEEKRFVAQIESLIMQINFSKEIPQLWTKWDKTIVILGQDYSQNGTRLQSKLL